MNEIETFQGKIKGKTKTKSTWNNYQLVIKDGLIKLYKGKVLKGDYDLTGCTIELSNDSSLSFTLLIANQQKTILSFLGEDENEINKIINVLNKGIYNKNVTSLSNGLRTPQVIDWFFQKQAEFREYESMLKTRYKFFLHDGPNQVQDFKQSVVYLSINNSNTGLAIEIENPDHTLNLIHTISFRDFLQVNKQSVEVLDSLKSTTIESNTILNTNLIIKAYSRDESTTTTTTRSSSNAIPPIPPIEQISLEISTFIFGCYPPSSELDQEILTNDQELTYTLPIANTNSNNNYNNYNNNSNNNIQEYVGIGEDDYFDEWLTGLIIAQSFCIIPSPVHTLLSPTSIPGGNSKTSTGRFVCSSDVIILLRSFESFFQQIPSLELFSKEIIQIFNNLSNVKCNLDAACCFGHRLEEIIRMLSNPRQGILRYSLPTYYNTLQSHLLVITNKLIEIKNFIISLTRPGWLVITLYGHTRNRPLSRRILSSASLTNVEENRPFLRVKYEEFDNSLMTLINRIIKDYVEYNLDEFETTYQYDMILEVTELINNYGGIKQIKSDKSKIRALSRLLQSSEVELEIELRSINPSMKSRLCQNIFCCFTCCISSSNDPSLSSSSSLSSNNNNSNNNNSNNSRGQFSRSKVESIDQGLDSNNQRKSQSKRTVSNDLSEGLLSDTSSYGAKAGDVDFFQPTLREEQQQQQQQNYRQRENIPK